MVFDYENTFCNIDVDIFYLGMDVFNYSILEIKMPVKNSGQVHSHSTSIFIICFCIYKNDYFIK